MTKTLDLIIWGRQFSLPIEYDCYAGESVTEEQIAALEVFASHEDWIQKAKRQVEAYCKKRVMEDAQNEKKNNIFSYIKPEALFVKRDEGHPRVALMCKYRYDPENGLAVVFNAKGNATVGAQDIIL